MAPLPYSRISTAIAGICCNSPAEATERCGAAPRRRREGVAIANHASGLSMLLMVLTMATAPHSTSAADSLAVSGTLVVATPSRDGLMVAADTRARLGPDVCDSHYKIVEPSRPDRTVFAVVGRSMHIEGPPPAMPDPCTH